MGETSSGLIGMLDDAGKYRDAVHGLEYASRMRADAESEFRKWETATEDLRAKVEELRAVIAGTGVAA